MLQIVVSSLVELTILEISGLQEDLGSFIMETINLIKVLQFLTLECRFHFGRLFVFWKLYIRSGWIWTLRCCGLKLCMLLSFCMDICLGGVLKNIYVASDA
jgi:hypothetical protein